MESTIYRTVFPVWKGCHFSVQGG